MSEEHKPDLIWDNYEIAMGHAKAMVEDGYVMCNIAGCGQAIQPCDMRSHLCEHNPDAENISEKCLKDFFEELDEDTAFGIIQCDQDLGELEWDDFIINLEDYMNALNPDGHWYVEGFNLGWRRLNGYNTFSTTDAKEFIQKITPDSQWSLQMWKKDDCLRFNISSHDSPMGSTVIAYVAKECPECGDIVEAEDLKTTPTGTYCKSCLGM